VPAQVFHHAGVLEPNRRPCVQWRQHLQVHLHLELCCARHQQRFSARHPKNSMHCQARAQLRPEVRLRFLTMVQYLTALAMPPMATSLTVSIASFSASVCHPQVHMLPLAHYWCQGHAWKQAFWQKSGNDRAFFWVGLVKKSSGARF